ncbi:MAG: hypothetical protein KBD93_04435, partial [Streptococcus sp.]|nr:hypothetical protein [Streptococcus sp.]
DYFILSGEIENRKTRDSSMVASNSFPYACLYWRSDYPLHYKDGTEWLKTLFADPASIGGQAIPCTSLTVHLLSS